MTTIHDDLESITHELVTIDGRRMWQFSNGRILPYVAGGDGSDDGDDSGGDDGSDGDDGDGGSDDDGNDADGTDDGDDGDDDPKLTAARADVLKWKRQARKHEKRAKENKAALDRANSTKARGSDSNSGDDNEPDLDRVREETRNETLRGVAEKSIELYLDAQVEAGRLDDNQADVLLDSIDASKFIDDDGDVDTDKVKTLIKGIAKPAKGSNGNGDGKPVDTGQGRRQAAARSGEKASYASGRDLWDERHPASN